ncbi:hypothetical protein B0H15DRAFT_951268 [Mycena belliarum]|uniref:CxC2-like cysteine cluster KDZ transposase-associated domain-containing protein n=1 Tax=Mycena belliarum TaxID=1033014 RepID=A0AAD6U2I5_9AGAR|nr:hypothetical protein B0H15DRAFT_951268 [Mycena belliae]
MLGPPEVLPLAPSKTGTGSTTVHTHRFSLEDLGIAVPAPPRIQATVERASEDGRRVYTELLFLEPPSPLKRPRREQQSDWVDVPFEGAAQDPISILRNERYEMFADDALPPPKKKRARRKGRGRFEPTLREWRPMRDNVLRELLRRDGTGDAGTSSCPRCSKRPAVIRCKSCFGDLLYCEECAVAMHEHNPLHVVQHWDGVCYTKMYLKDLGLRIQFGHRGCVRPCPGHQTFVVLHLGVIQEVAVDFCGCEQEFLHGTPDIQLLRRGWFPATDDQPQTAATFELLDFFHAQTLQAKTTMYDFYVALEKMTDNTGVKPPNRYPEFLKMARKYRHLLMLKRAGRGHDPSGVNGTQPGECAVQCPACPRPGINLPDNWETAPPEDKFLYFFFIALDACFRLKRRLISSDLRDPGLGTGWSYFTENEQYRQFLLTVTDQKEMSTCSGLAALDYANTKFSRGYSSTGVGMGVCARHEFVLPTGVGDLQKGERFVNMDYILASILRHIDRRLLKVISYDIVCQWWKHLLERLLKLPPLLRLRISLAFVRFVIPKMHIHSHTLACQVLFSLNLLLGAGQTDGEGIERPWANIGGVATSTREQGPGARHDTLDDHWGYWNWVKLTIIARLIRRRLDAARVESVVQAEGFEAFSAQQPERVETWKRMVHTFENDATQPNPYEAKVIGLTEAQVRLQFSEEEAKQVELGVPALHDVSPSSFIYAGLGLEDEQRRLRVQAELKKAGTSAQKIGLTAMRTKLTRGIQRFRRLQSVYTPAALQAASRAATQAAARAATQAASQSGGKEAAAHELPEDTPLFLPSALTEEERRVGCIAGLDNIEGLARDAQCRTALVRLRHQLHMKSRLMVYKKTNARHQGANTRSRTIVARNESKVRLHSEKYQCAWEAIRLLNGGDPEKVGWLKLRRQDIRMMEDKEELTKRMERKKKQEAKRRERERRLIEEGEILAPPEDSRDVSSGGEEDGSSEEREARGGENRREVSWIWAAAGTSGTDTDLEDALRIEWAKAYARSRRWNEEMRLLEEEARRILVSFDYSAFVWDQRAMAINIDKMPEEAAEGAIAYAVSQARMFRKIKSDAERTLTEPKLANGKKRQAPRMQVGREGLESDGDSGPNSDWEWEEADRGEDDIAHGEVYSDEEAFLGGEDEGD